MYLFPGVSFSFGKGFQCFCDNSVRVRRQGRFRGRGGYDVGRPSVGVRVVVVVVVAVVSKVFGGKTFGFGVWSGCP